MECFHSTLRIDKLLKTKGKKEINKKFVIISHSRNFGGRLVIQPKCHNAISHESESGMLRGRKG